MTKQPVISYVVVFSGTRNGIAASEEKGGGIARAIHYCITGACNGIHWEKNRDLLKHYRRGKGYSSLKVEVSRYVNGNLSHLARLPGSVIDTHLELPHIPAKSALWKARQDVIWAIAPDITRNRHKSISSIKLASREIRTLQTWHSAFSNMRNL